MKDENIYLNIQKEENVFAAVTYFRFLQELDLIEEGMKAKEPVDYSDKRKLQRFFIKNFTNKKNRKDTERLSETKQEMLNKIDEFKNDCKEKGVSFESGKDKNALAEAFQKHFRDDIYGMRKRFFAIRCALDSAYDYYRKETTLSVLSDVLFQDKDFIARLYDEFTDFYKEICRESYKDVEKGVLMGVGIASVASIILTPAILTATASASSVLTSCLAQIGRSAPGIIGAGLIKMSLNVAILSTALFVGSIAGVAVSAGVKNAKMTEAFRNASLDDVKFLFALKATLMQESKKAMPDDAFKTTLDDCLKELSDLRADQEYLYLVEKTNAKEAKEKRKMCNILIDKFATIVGV